MFAQFVEDAKRTPAVLKKMLPSLLAFYTNEQISSLSYEVHEMFKWAAFERKELNISLVCLEILQEMNHADQKGNVE